MRGLLGGIATGALVSALGLGTLSVVNAPPVRMAPDSADAPPAQAAAQPVAGMPAAQMPAEDMPAAEIPAAEMPAEELPGTPATQDAGGEGGAETAAAQTPPAGSSPVGAVTVDVPLAPDLPDDAAMLEETESAPEAPATPEAARPDTATPLADTAPAPQPDAMSLDGTLDAPDAPEGAEVTPAVEAPVLPNPQSLPPQTPVNETDLVLSTEPAQPVITVDEPAAASETAAPDTGAVVAPARDVFVVDLGADAATNAPEGQSAAERAAEGDATPQDNAEDDRLASAGAAPAAPRVQLQGGQNTLLEDRGTGVTVRRPTDDPAAPETAERPVVALAEYAAQTPDTNGAPLLSVVLIDDGSMSAASAALAGLPFPVTIALDPADAGAAERMAAYRAAGVEVVVLARMPEGARSSDVEVTLGAVFATLPETIAVLDIGNGGLQQDADVTAQAMDILAAGGRGFLTASQGLNMASRAAERADVPAAVIYRDLDADGQDARVIRRFVDQAAFQARRESGVVLVGRVRPDTISALILWGAANQDAQVALVPVSAVLRDR